MLKAIIMKLKFIAWILALTVASWAQTTTQNTPAQQENAAPQSKVDCCHKADSAKEGQSCRRHEMAGKDEKAMSCCSGEKAAACCEGTEAKSCAKADKDKTAAAGECCGNMKSCSHEKGDKSAMNCSEKQCGEHCAGHSSTGGK